MTAVLTHSRNEYFGLRPMDPMKDLRGVADLIEKAFASELDRSGHSALRELRWLSRLRPLLWWMVYSNADHSDFLSGFVWEEDGKIVGNITVNRTAPGSRRWLISNLAVDEGYQGRGIARGLMYAGLELVNEYGGTSTSLQVRADNIPAKHLYDTLNFKEISGTTYLRIGRVPRVPPNLGLTQLPTSLIMRSKHSGSQDTRQAYNLAVATTPINAQKEWPLRQSSFRLGHQAPFNSLFRRFIGSGPVAHWVVDDGARFVGQVNIYPGTFGKAHRISLMVHPDWRDYLERSLISRACHYLYPWRNNGIIVQHPASHPEAVESFKEFGFQETQTLLWMKRDM